MSGIGGIGVLKQIRALDKKAAVIMLTSAESEAMESQATLFGITEFLRKGAALETLMARVEQSFKGSSDTAPDTHPTNGTAGCG